MIKDTFKFKAYVESDKEFVMYCRGKKSYQKFIGDSTSTANLYIIKYGQPIGLLEVYDINTEDLNLAINVFLLDDYTAVGGLALFKAIDFIFSKYKVHKIILKVFDCNEKMNNILNKLSIFHEGRVIVDCCKNRYVNIYSILENEYNAMRNSSWRKVISGGNG